MILIKIIRKKWEPIQIFAPFCDIIAKAQKYTDFSTKFQLVKAKTHKNNDF